MQTIKIRQVTVPLNISNDHIFMIEEDWKIGKLLDLICKRIHINKHQIKLYYAGKELVPEHSALDYHIKNNDVIQLLIRHDSGVANLTTVSFQEENHELIAVTSHYYMINDQVDVLFRELGAWFEAKIIGIYINKSYNFQEENLIYKVVMDREEQTAPITVYSDEIRPRARYVYKKKELVVGMVIFVNYNITKPKQRGFWYDFKITSLNYKKSILCGSLILGKNQDDIHHCLIKFKNELMRIETSTLLTQRTGELPIMPLRKLPLYCQKCRDISSKKCKECSCTVCGEKKSIDKLIICDECECTFHLFCLVPPIQDIPSDPEWYCPDCKTDENEIIRAGETLKSTPVEPKPATVSKATFGDILGIRVGSCWDFLWQVYKSGIHQTMDDIHSDEKGVYSLVLNNELNIGHDNGEEFCFTILGHSVKRCYKISSLSISDMPKSVKELSLNCKNLKPKGAFYGVSADWMSGNPVRVIRSCVIREVSKFAPTWGYRYDGIYKILEFFPAIQRKDLIWRFVFKRCDPTLLPWLKIDTFIPTCSHVTEAPPEKVRKLEASFMLHSKIMKFIKSDVGNAKMWDTCLSNLKDGCDKFLEVTKELFTCVCCQDVVYKPVTTSCNHNFCYDCLMKCFDSDIYQCPNCRLSLDKERNIEVNTFLGGALELIFAQ